MEQGAEACVEIRDEKVIKKREDKEYRHPELDRKLREDRTDEELKNIQRARKYGANVPKTEKISEKTLSQEKITGKALKQVIDKKINLAENLGEQIGLLHDADVIHGDLTTSNVLIGDKLYIIDFGLSEISQRVEDKAVDIHLLKQVLESSHPEVADEAWEKFIEEYKDYEESEEVLERLEDVESRGRYK